MHYNTAVVLAGASLLGACCGLVGSFAVLRKRSLIGDALAHAALPGLCLAFLVVGAKSLPAMLFGALLTGLAGIAVVSALPTLTRIKEDAAIGVVLSVAFGAGVVLLRLIQNQVTAGSKAGLDSFILGKTAGMVLQDVLLIGGVALCCLLLILSLYKEFKLVTFDPAFAQVQGWPSYWLDLLLMGMIAVTVVIGLPAVGVVLISALLILPGATARFWTHDLTTTLVISTLMGAVFGGAGTMITATYPLPAGPCVVLAGGACFLASVLLAPRRGLLARVLEEHRYRTTIDERRLLAAAYELIEPEIRKGRTAVDCPLTRQDLLSKRPGSERRLDRALARTLRADLLERDEQGRFALTETGLQQAARIVLQYRLCTAALERDESGAALLNPDDAAFREQLPPETIGELERALREQGLFPLGAGAPSEAVP